ncbi:hypothetical protein Leryth_005552 [Lithospermum erythrorhizon]|nr:hypothetical protein Leryth_005552 [Lithospermum erythrorhizon]
MQIRLRNRKTNKASKELSFVLKPNQNKEWTTIKQRTKPIPKLKGPSKSE